MLIIGHRGAKDEAPENTIESIRRGIADDADMIEIDVRITSDGIPVLSHDSNLIRTHKQAVFINKVTLKELVGQTKGSINPIATLEDALKECRGMILLNIEIKSTEAVLPTLEIVKKVYKSKKSQSEELLFSSFKPRALSRIRETWPHAQLALLHSINPLSFIAWQKKLDLSAVGFHRLHYNAFALQIAQKLNLFTYVYTEDRTGSLKKLNERGIDGVVTNRPASMIKVARKLTT